MHIRTQRFSLQINENIVQTCNLLTSKKQRIKGKYCLSFLFWSLPIFNILKTLIRSEGKFLPCILQFDLYFQFRYHFYHCLKNGSSFKIHFPICNFDKTDCFSKSTPFGGHYVDYIVYLHLKSSFGPLLCVPIGTTNMLTACRPQTSP